MSASMNHFKQGVTDTIYIHSGRFHADDVLFAAMASIAIQKHKKTPIIKRTNDPDGIRGENVIVGDIGRGVYDHHVEGENISVGAENNTEDHLAAACGLLYKDISNILFPGSSETKNVFEAFLDIIEHCDNTPDNSTFSDSINLLTPSDVSLTEERVLEAIRYCKDVIYGFIDAHNKERAGKIWAVPKTNKSVLPGIPTKVVERYIKCPNSVSSKYKYVSYNNKQDMKLRAMSTYSIAMSVLPDFKRRKWKSYIEKCDRENQEELLRRETEEWPEAVKNMTHLTITINNYLPWTKYIKDINAVFIIQESQRGGYSVYPIKTNNGKYRCSPSVITNAVGCSYIANDSRFILFESKEAAQEAAQTAGASVEEFLKKNGLQGYRKIYGGCFEEYTGALYQDIISEDIALKCYMKDVFNDRNQITSDEFHVIQKEAEGNDYMTHCICCHFSKDNNGYEWNKNANVVDDLKTSQGQLKTSLL